MIRAIYLITLLLCIMTNCDAQENFVMQKEVATQIAGGAENDLDTYLSPEKYRGTEWRFESQVLRQSAKHPLTYMLTHEGALGNLHNRASNAHTLVGHYDFSYAMMRRWEMLPGRNLALMAGGMVDSFSGFAYNTRNSANNPAQAYISVEIGAQLMAQYRLRLLGMPLRVNYEMRMPFVGLRFSPNYGQSYYEMFDRGNYDGNVVLTSLATFQMRQQLSLDLFLGKRTALRIGYLSDIRQAKPNKLRQHQYYNAAVIGVVIRK